MAGWRHCGLPMSRAFSLNTACRPTKVYVRGAPLLVAGMASGDIQFGRSGGSATLAAVGAGHDFKIIATFSSRNSYDLIARPNIKRPEDLRGKKIALISIGGTGWMRSEEHTSELQSL